jgi:hypothetical protein
MSGEEGNPDEGHRLRQPNQSERQRIVGQVVDLPGHHNCLNLRGDGHGHEAGHEPAEVQNA